MYTVVPSRSLLLSPIHATTFPFLSLPRNLLTRLFLLLRPIVSFSSMVISILSFVCLFLFDIYVDVYLYGQPSRWPSDSQEIVARYSQTGDSLPPDSFHREIHACLQASSKVAPPRFTQITIVWILQQYRIIIVSETFVWPIFRKLFNH